MGECLLPGLTKSVATPCGHMCSAACGSTAVLGPTVKVTKEKSSPVRAIR